MSEANRRSKNITEGVARAPNRSMYYAMGYTEQRLRQADDRRGQRPQHDHALQLAGLQRLADAAVAALKAAGANPQVFGTPTISRRHGDGHRGHEVLAGVARGHRRLRRDLRRGQWMDGVLVVGGCDKNMPGGMMGMLRANVPAIYVYGGTIKPGQLEGPGPEHRQRFEAVGAVHRPAR
jgi:dihydroxy-acid dehydratase